jgi:exonuclease SbcC
MIPLRVYLKGFMSYRDEATLSFDGASLWVLSGPNGAGKSAIFDAITFALYGSHRGGSQNAKDLINHHADALEVEFDFLMDGEAYRVRRTVSRRGQATREAFLLHPTGPEPESDTASVQGFKDWRERVIGLEYETFTSSVVLLQGQSEKLLDMQPRERHKALSELIDLSPYERLHKAAGEYRQHHKSLAEHHMSQLQNTPVVGDEELTTAENTAERTEKEWREAGDRVDGLIELVGSAKSWERLAGELVERRGEAEKAQRLFDREEEIHAGFERLQQIKQTLPMLESFVGDKERLADHERDEAKAQEKRHGIESDLEATGEKKAADGEVERLTGLIGELKSTDAGLAELVSKLKPEAEHLERLDGVQAELEEAKEKLDTLLPDLEQTIGHAEKEDDRLAQAERALPWLKQLVRARSSLGEAMLVERGASDRLESLIPRLRECEGECERLSTEAGVVRKEEDELNHCVTRDQARCDDARKRRASFDGVSTQPTCELCGQEITQEHVEQEMARLDACVTETKVKLEDSKNRREQATSRLKALQKELGEAETARGELLKERERLENERWQAGRDAHRHAKQAEDSFNSLPISYQSRVASEVPEGAEWTATIYPADPELEELKKEVDGKVAHAKHLRELRELLGRKQRWDESFQSASKRLSKLLETLSWDEARGARDDLTAHQTRRQELRIERARLEETHREAAKEANECNEMVEKLSRELQENKTEIKTLQAARKEIERALHAGLERLPDDWREQAESAGSEELERWREERDELDEYESLFPEMEHARRSTAGLEKRISELGVWINEIPEEARRPTGEVEEELSGARSQAEEKDAERRKAERHFDELQQRREQRQELENCRREAERQRRAYDTLHNLLGPKGVQARLLRVAERDLVSLANETLDGLSRQRMRLELREGDDQQRALDLVVLDSGTGSNPVAVSLTSGSQRFRIAVSLALAIGRYKGQQARRIQSVIIDEGFGSLDKNSRDDMIQVLNDLQQALDRIILVSHQEEFANAFTNGYAVSLEDNSSKVESLQLS